MPGQRLPTLTAAQQDALARLDSKRPSERKAFLETLLTSTLKLGSDPGVRAFGLEVAQQLVGVRARVLPAPALAYGVPDCMHPGTQVRGKNGFWQHMCWVRVCASA